MATSLVTVLGMHMCDDLITAPSYCCCNSMTESCDKSTFVRLGIFDYNLTANHIRIQSLQFYPLMLVTPNHAYVDNDHPHQALYFYWLIL